MKLLFGRVVHRVLTTSKGLTFCVFFYNCKVSGLRGNKEHRNLDASQFDLLCVLLTESPIYCVILGTGLSMAA